MVYLRGRGLVENEEQDENKMMKSIVVEEQEQEQEQEEGSESGFVFDLDEDMLHNVLKRVDMVTLGRAECVNKLWLKVAGDERLWEPIIIRLLAGIGGLSYIDEHGTMNGALVLGRIRRRRLISVAKPPPDFYSIDFSKKIKPWVQN